jgi:5-formyltetrahydrofolate cyclo-ligase
LKAQLRTKYKKLRAKLSEQEIEALSHKIIHQLTHNFDLKSKKISLFLPIKKFKEVNTWPLLDQGDSVFYLPVVNKNRLKHIRFESINQLKTSAWGIDEPVDGEEGSPKDFDMVIVPLLAYDIKGNRIGYGAGYYDQFLKECNPNCQFIGVSFFEPEPLIFDTYSSDIPLHYVVTPLKVIKF